MNLTCCVNFLALHGRSAFLRVCARWFSRHVLAECLICGGSIVSVTREDEFAAKVRKC